MAADLRLKAPPTRFARPGAATSGIHDGRRDAVGGGLVRRHQCARRECEQPDLDILGSGINNSVFAGGGAIGGTAGYQFWNGQFFLAAEVNGDVNVSPGGISGAVGSHSFEGNVLAKAGIGLSNIIGIGPVPERSTCRGRPSQGISLAAPSTSLMFGSLTEDDVTIDLGGSRSPKSRLDDVPASAAAFILASSLVAGIVDVFAMTKFLEQGRRLWR